MAFLTLKGQGHMLRSTFSEGQILEGFNTKKRPFLNTLNLFSSSLNIKMKKELKKTIDHPWTPQVTTNKPKIYIFVRNLFF